jgi:hydroxypyruvate reductase
VIAGGETTVTVTGRGKGGRNQEVALGAAVALDELLGGGEGQDAERVLVASAGTDGIDGPTDAAGAMADGATVARGRKTGADPARALAENDARPYFRALRDLIQTGPTGTNVMDLACVLVGR